MRTQTPCLVVFGEKKSTSSFHLLFCKWCGVEFDKGETILSKTKSHGKRAHYHKTCAERLNII